MEAYLKQSFLKKVAKILKENTTDYGNGIPARILCEKLELSLVWESTLRTLIREGVIPGYKLRPNTGFVRENATAKTTDGGTVVPAFFVTQFQQALDECCNDDTYVSSDTVLSKMKHHYAQVKAKALMGSAIKHGLVSGYVSKTGAGGGYKRATKEEEDLWRSLRLSRSVTR